LAFHGGALLVVRSEDLERYVVRVAKDGFAAATTSAM
jgi:hypothetical protein